MLGPVLKDDFVAHTLRILVIGLNFGMVMHSTMGQMQFKNYHAWSIETFILGYRTNEGAVDLWKPYLIILP